MLSWEVILILNTSFLLMYTRTNEQIINLDEGKTYGLGP